MMGKKDKKKLLRGELHEAELDNKVHLILKHGEMDNIFVTMLYNAQHGFSHEQDVAKTEFLQRLLGHVSERLIYMMANDIQTLSIIEHWGLKHPAVKDQLNKLLIDRVLKDAPDGINLKDVHSMAAKYKSGVMFEADRRATEVFRHYKDNWEDDSSFTILTVEKYK